MIVAAALALAACKGDKNKPAESKALADKPVEHKPVKPQPTLIRRDAVDDVLRAWLDAQNHGDLAAYSALYADEFRGVRRTGDKRVALDRAGWLADRKRMFRKPMVVVARDVSIGVGPKGAEIRFTQDWTSGAYRDIGPKEIRLGESAGKLLIVREEMLRSTVVGTGDLPVASARLALVYKGDLVIAGSPELDWGAGDPTLESGELVEQPSHCSENPPDYEAEHERYWECHNAEPGNVTGRFSASQKLDRAKAGPLIRHWRGKTVALYGATGKLCQASVRGLELWAEIETTQDAVTRGASVAGEVMSQSNPIVVGDLDKPCRGALYARDPDLEPPPAWTIGPAPPALLKAVTDELDKLTEGEMFDADGAPTITARLLAPPEPGGRRFVYGVKSGVESCSSYNREAAVWEVKGNRLELVGEASELETLTAAADTDGDGAPELIFDNGFLVWREDGYAEIRPVDFPDQVVPCICECE